MFTLKEISVALKIPFEGDGSLIIESLSEPSTANINQLALAMDKGFSEQLTLTKARAAIVLAGIDWRSMGLQGVLLVGNGRLALSKVNDLFETEVFLNKGIHPSAIIAETAELGRNVCVGAFSIIGENCVIGDNSRIFNHVSISENVELGSNALVYPGVRIGPRVEIGDRFFCHQNSVIGSDGFSFVPEDDFENKDIAKDKKQENSYKEKRYLRIASLGSVTIENDVEVGASTTIDRGTISNTLVRSGTKIDNLVHLGHNVRVGRNCLICGQVGIAGSAVLGDRVVLGGQVGVADHISVGNDSIIAGKSGVSSNVPANRFMMGNPATKIENNIASYKALRRLPKIIEKIEKLQKFVLK